MESALSLLLAFSVGLHQPPNNQFDLIEINTINGQFTQAIWREWDQSYRRYNCHGWSIDFEIISESPPRIRARGAIITAPILRYSATDCDPERDNRRWFPEQHRRELQKAGPRK